ncbi:MAG: TetR/AcrR family transcriptional regulator [Acidobacteria bacterium]|nr:TetR/AcrR family transcriptional regulator [Acidobacteriota bacterium]
MSSKILSKIEESPGEACESKQPGRPRCPLTHQNILKAARELVEEVGFDSLTIEGIAARAGVGKTTIYRRWPNKANIVLDAFFEDLVPSVSFSDTGNVREDMRRHLKKFVKELNGPLGCKISMLLANGQFDEEMADAFRLQWIEPRRDEARQVIERGIERGEIHQKVDPDLLIDALYGPIYFRLLAGHAPLTPSFAESLTELVMSGLDG